jgi:murein DD-endopeptidase MepM/ murein hydrolase activator NlpD
MEKKYLSLIIIPHTKMRSKNISFSRRTIRVIAGLAVFVSLALTLFLIDYFTMSVTRKKYRNLLDEKAKQDKTIVQYKDTIEKLQTTIEHYESYAKKLNVMAGLKSQETIEGEPGIGGPSDGQEISDANSGQTLDLDSLKDISQKAAQVEKNLDTLNTFFEDRTLELASRPSIWPTKGYMSSAYGWRDDPFTGKRAFHRGIDIATYQGNPVYSTADGVVIQARFDKIGGKTIKIKHMFGYTTVYCHLSEYLVKVGQKVKRWDKIGLVGSTGKAGGPHVHYEVHFNGKALNPYNFILEE